MYFTTCRLLHRPDALVAGGRVSSLCLCGICFSSPQGIPVTPVSEEPLV